MRGRRFLSFALAAVMVISAVSGLVLLQEKPALAASTTSKYFIGSANGAEKFDDYTIEENKWSDTGKMSVTEIPVATPTPAVGEAVSTDSDGNMIRPTYVDGKSLRFSHTANSTWSSTTNVYTADTDITNGKVYFSTDIYFATEKGSHHGADLYLRNSNGEPVVTVSMPAYQSSGYGYTKVNGSNIMLGLNTRGGFGARISIVVDLDKNEANVDIDYIAQNDSNKRRTAGKTVTISDNSDIQQFAVRTAAQSNTDYNIIDNTWFYSEYIENKAKSLEISYVNIYTFSEVAKKTISLEAESYAIGENISYNLPACIIGDDDKLYMTWWSTDSDGHNILKKEQPLDAENTKITEYVYPATNSGYEASYQYEEFDGESVYGGHNEYASNGSVKTIGKGDTTLLTVKEEGDYNVLIVTALTNVTPAPTEVPTETEAPTESVIVTPAPYETDETAEPDSGDYNDTKKGAVLKTDSYVIDGGSGGIDFYSIPTFCQYSNVHLTKGAKLILTGYSENSAVDYVVITKSGEYEAPEVSYGSYTRKMEKLNRGLFATYTGSGVYLSWRLLGTESLTDQAFDIYRNGEKIHTTGAHDATNYTDKGGTSTSQYIVVPAGESISGETAVTPKGKYVVYNRNLSGSIVPNYNSYFDINISQPAWQEVAPLGSSASEGVAKEEGDDLKSDGESGIEKDDGTTATEAPSGAYSPNDASVGDLDGDGEYELVLKWNPSNSQENMPGNGTFPNGFSSNVYIDAYEFESDGTPLWRIDLGKNIRAGAHYTQFIVYDLDGDGRAEVAMKTAPGSKDGLGNYVTVAGDTDEIRTADNTADYRSKYGMILEGSEYLTIFDGATGKALCTTDYISRGDKDKWKSTWGDNFGNRMDRLTAAVAYLDGENPSLIMCRGYYGQVVMAAYDWNGNKITHRWESTNLKTNGEDICTVVYEDGSTKTCSPSAHGDGNHQLYVCDADNDGKDEIVTGSAIIDDNGLTLNTTDHGHGDALHVSDFDNDGEQEIFQVHEATGTCQAGYGAELRKAATGKIIVGQRTGGDNGRGFMDNVLDDVENSGYAQFWSSGISGTYGWTGAETLNETVEDESVVTWYGADNITKLKDSQPAGQNFINFGIYWDGDLARELLDGNKVGKLTSSGWKRFYWGSSTSWFPECSSNNSSKSNPCLSADIIGDWREEVIFRVGDTKLRMFVPAEPTDYRLYTLMHDSQYRTGVAGENVDYNQPPHTSYYIGRAALAKDPATGETFNYLAPAVPYTSVQMIEPVATSEPVTVEVKAPEKVTKEGKETWDLVAENTVSIPSNKTVSGDGITFMIDGYEAGKTSKFSAASINGGAVTFKLAITDIPSDVGISEFKDAKFAVSVAYAIADGIYKTANDSKTVE